VKGSTPLEEQASQTRGVAIGRNEPCPCGSGKRYKECHGALGAAPAVPSATAWIPNVMREALQAQREGRVVEAAQRYRRVLAAQPANFDATHMLSLVEYEIGHYAEAVSLIRRAIELRPELGTPRQNLRLLESLPLMEIEVCREALSRQLSRVDAHFDPARLAQGRPVHVLGPFGEAERDALGKVVAACGPSPVHLWLEASADSPAGLDAIRLSVDEHPRGGWLVLLGAMASMSGWLPVAQPEGVLVIATRDEPCAIVDRVDELAHAGYASPGLVCATPALSRRLGLPPAAVLEAAPEKPKRDAA